MSKRSQRVKPVKPAGSPISPHPNGQWFKKIRGRAVYFGPWHNFEAALARYNRCADDLHAGRVLTIKRAASSVNVGMVLEAYCDRRADDVEAGMLSARQLADYIQTANFTGKMLGPATIVAELKPHDFDRLLRECHRRWGFHRVTGVVTRVRTMFNWAHDPGGYIEHPVQFGKTFRRPSKKMARRNRRQRGPMIFSRAELLAMLERAGPTMRAMMLLGLNGGFGNSDCSELPIDTLTLDGAASKIDWPRPKTEIRRVVPLWPETVRAIRDVLSTRRHAPGESRVFLTRRGNAWVRFRLLPCESGGVRPDNTNVITTQFAKLMRLVSCHRPGHGFYTLRRVFRTVADESRDLPAVDVIMGHLTPGMGADYVQHIGFDRIHAVASYVRRWLFSGEVAEPPL